MEGAEINIRELVKSIEDTFNYLCIRDSLKLDNCIIDIKGLLRMLHERTTYPDEIFETELPIKYNPDSDKLTGKTEYIPEYIGSIMQKAVNESNNSVYKDTKDEIILYNVYSYLYHLKDEYVSKPENAPVIYQYEEGEVYEGTYEHMGYIYIWHDRIYDLERRYGLYESSKEHLSLTHITTKLPYRSYAYRVAMRKIEEELQEKKEKGIQTIPQLAGVSGDRVYISELLVQVQKVINDMESISRTELKEQHKRTMGWGRI